MSEVVCWVVVSEETGRPLWARDFIPSEAGGQVSSHRGHGHLRNQCNHPHGADAAPTVSPGVWSRW